MPVNAPISLLATGMAFVMPVVGYATEAEIRILNVGAGAGTMRVAVCPQANFLQPTCPFVGTAPAHPGEVTVVIRNIPPGIYAVQAHHDVHDKGRIDTNFLGIPVEGLGFSRGAAFRFGPPRFDDAALSIAGKVVGIDITLTFEP